MGMVHAITRSAAKFVPGVTPAAVLGRANEHLYEDFTTLDSFATAFVGQYDPAAQTLCYANAGHAPVIATLRPGVLDVTAGGSKRRLFVKSGFAEVDPSRLTVLAEKAYDVDEMSSSAIAEELKSAEADLAAAKDDNAKRMADTLVNELKRLSARAA